MGDSAFSRVVWQLSGGPPSYSHAKLFLNYGVGLIGPGDPGPWAPSRYAYDHVIQGFIDRFATEVQVGDVFLLRNGLRTICAVGIVASDYMYLEQFDDVNGWDLQHARRVRWYSLPQGYTFKTLVFGRSPSRFSRVLNDEAIDYVARFLKSPPTIWQASALPELPSDEPALGEVPEHLRGIVAEADDLVPLFRDRQGFGDQPAEDEMIVHLVVPFFRALGWPPELVGVKWHHIDVVVFRRLPWTPENCQFVVEVKRLDSGVEGALEQAKGYVTAIGALRDIVVTDGIRYRLYSSEDGFQCVAYANLVKMKESASQLFARLRKS